MTDKKFPSPEEVQKEFEDFVHKRFGENVKVVSHTNTPDGRTDLSDDEPTAADKSRVDVANFSLKPKDVKKHLDRFVIKQDEAKKALAIAVCDHYNHVKQCIEDPSLEEAEYSKQNVLILGPTGVGKTYLVKQIAKLIGVPFVKADATRFTETGYVGANVDDMVRDLVSHANGDIEMAQFGIVYIDEIDKLASTGATAGSKDVSGRGVQSGLLKLMEETEIDLSSGNDMRSQMQAFMEMQTSGKIRNKVVNTKHILFIVSGAFSQLDDIVKTRLNQKDIGFAASAIRESMDSDHLSQVATEDLVDYGFEPEFIGRLPIRVACQELEKRDLATILKCSEGSIIKQYEQAFRAYDIDLMFSEGALDEIASQAHSEKTGARALMTVCETALRPFKYELPSSQIKELYVTPEIIREPAKELEKIFSDPQYDRHLTRIKAIARFEDEFHRRHEMRIEFSDDAAEKICEIVSKTNRPVAEVCKEILTSYEHGLKLIQQNTGQHSFSLGLDVVENPQSALERMIQASYKRQERQDFDGPTESL